MYTSGQSTQMTRARDYNTLLSLMLFWYHIWIHLWREHFFPLWLWAFLLISNTSCYMCIDGFLYISVHLFKSYEFFCSPLLPCLFVLRVFIRIFLVHVRVGYRRSSCIYMFTGGAWSLLWLKDETRSCVPLHIGFLCALNVHWLHPIGRSPGTCDLLCSMQSVCAKPPVKYLTLIGFIVFLPKWRYIFLPQYIWHVFPPMWELSNLVDSVYCLALLHWG